MNWQRGIKRIVFLISIVVGLGVGVFYGFLIADDMQNENQRFQLLRSDAPTGKIYVLKKTEETPV